MRYLLADKSLVYAGRSRAGFPLLLDENWQRLEPFHSFLWELLLESGRAYDEEGTWDNYGRCMWDFARFLDANRLSWNKPFDSVGDSVLRMYRDWQALDLGLSSKTINHRLRLIEKFYVWAMRNRLIDRLPFTRDDTRVITVDHEMTHVTGSKLTRHISNLALQEWEEDPVFLNARQIKIARTAIRCTEHRILFDLMARVGLRSIEARTFPQNYVFNANARKDISQRSLIDVHLDPKTIRTKYSKQRTVHIPFSLMEDMYTYLNFERGRRVPTTFHPPLLITSHGNSYSKTSVHKVMADLGRRVGFPIRPLMLRHSYAIHTLLLLRKNPSIEVEPLLYVRDRLGHENVQTTMIYLQQMERLMTAESMALIEEFDQMYDVTQTLLQNSQFSNSGNSSNA